MKRLLVANCATLTKYSGKDVGAWAEIYKVININVSLVDRMGRFQPPFNFGLYDKFKLPTDTNDFKETYEGCCERRASELLRIQEELRVPIALFYSGGIDSTLVLVTFAKLLGPQLKDRIKVFLSMDSIVENPSFYYSFIRRNCHIESSEVFSSLFDGSHIIVTGEHNDQLFGSDIIGAIGRHAPFDEILARYSRKFIVSFFKLKGMSDGAAGAWFDLLDEHARRAPCGIETVYDFFWWLNFVFKWQAVYFRMLLRVDREQQKLIDRRFIDTYYQHFFGTAEFQKWSMANKDEKVGRTWKSYKHAAKKLIYEFNGDRDYFEQKTKTGSLFKLFLQKNTALAMTTDFEFLSELAPEEFYARENSFSRVKDQALTM